MESTTKPAFLYFDDECLVCNGFVQFILKQDRGRGSFRFASLHMPTGQKMLEALKEKLGDRETMVLVENGKRYIQSSAFLRILVKLGGPWLLVYPLLWIPATIRDFCYQLFAKNRYWFGKKPKACLLPSPEQRKYFKDPSPV